MSDGARDARMVSGAAISAVIFFDVLDPARTCGRAASTLESALTRFMRSGLRATAGSWRSCYPAGPE